MPNGTHAVVIEREMVRVEMFRYERTYDLLITRHWLEARKAKRPELRSELLYLGRRGTLPTELWGRTPRFEEERGPLSSRAAERQAPRMSSGQTQF
ncbi:MAG: hypothetical protein WBQ79_18795 [Acidobacteriaceae bacterium]